MLPAGMDPRTPVLVGVGQVVHRSGEPGLPGPVELAAEALRRAGADSGAGDRLVRAADVVAAVAPVSKPYPDLAAMVAGELGATPKRTAQTARFGGDGPQRLVNWAAQAIADGRAEVVLIAGAESVAAANAAKRAGTVPDWPDQPADAAPDEVLGSDKGPNSEMETGAGLWGPIYFYALMENALRGRLGLSEPAYLERIGGLWSRFSEIAATNPYAWLPERHRVRDLITATPDNRMVTSPYRKLLVANLSVDQGAGLILCSAAAADTAGVPRERWVFPHGGATGNEVWFVSERADMAASPAIAAVGAQALSDAGVGIDDIAHIDLYSCFPIAVQVGVGGGHLDAHRATAPGYTGPATVESYTVPYRKGPAPERADEPEAVVVSALNPAGARTLVRVSDPGIIAAFTETDPLGAKIDIVAADRITLSERTAR